MNELTKAELELMTRGYLETAQWADAPEGSRARFSNSAKESAAQDCEAFAKQCGALIREAIKAGATLERIGGDFWLDRCGHGAGATDREYADVPTEGRYKGRARFDGPEYEAGTTLGDALHDIAYGTNAHISNFAYASLTAYGGWLDFS